MATGTFYSPIADAKFGVYPIDMDSSSTSVDAPVDDWVSRAERAREKAKAHRLSPTQQTQKKSAKEKRNMRVKRRPTGVIRLPPTEKNVNAFEDDSESNSTSFDAAASSDDGLAACSGADDTLDSPGTPMIVVQSLSFPSDRSMADLEAEAEAEESADSRLLTLPAEVAPVVPPVPTATASSTTTSSTAMATARATVSKQPTANSLTVGSSSSLSAEPPVPSARLSSLLSRFESRGLQIEPIRSSRVSSFSSRLENDESTTMKPFARSMVGRHSFRNRAEQNNNNNVNSGLHSLSSGSSASSAAASAALSAELKRAEEKAAELTKKNTELEQMLEKVRTDALAQKTALQMVLREKEEEVDILLDRSHCQEVEISALNEEVRILDKDLEELDEDNINLVKENQALHCALKTLTLQHQQNIERP